MAGTSLTAAAAARRVNAQEATGETDRVVQEKTMMVRLLGLMQRGPGLTKTEIQVKSQQSYWPYAREVYRQATKQVNWDALQHIQNVVTDSAFGIEGQAPRSAFNPDVVAEFAMQVRGSAQPSRPGEQAATDTAGGLGQQPRCPTLPDFVEKRTSLTIVARQVVSQGNRPAAMSGRAKAMYFVKMSPAATPADQVKGLQTLHAKALQATPALADGLAGYEVLQRLWEVAAPSCGEALPVPDFVASFWFKTNRTVAQFPKYARALQGLDQQKAIDAAASFFLLVEEWESRTGTNFVG